MKVDVRCVITLTVALPSRPQCDAACAPDVQADIFRMVAAVLALGDVDFVERPDAKDEETLTELSEPTRPRLEAAARLLEVSPDKILSALTSRNINAGISNQVGVIGRPGRGDGGWPGGWGYKY